MRHGMTGFGAGLLAGAVLAASLAWAQGAIALRSASYGLVGGETVTIHCIGANGQPRRGSEPLVQPHPAMVGEVPHLTCF